MDRINHDGRTLRVRRRAVVALLGSAAGTAMAVGFVASAPTAHADCDTGPVLTPGDVAEINADGGIENGGQGGLNPDLLASILGVSPGCTITQINYAGGPAYAHALAHMEDVNQELYSRVFIDFADPNPGNYDPGPNINVPQTAAELAINVEQHPAEAAYPDQLAALYMQDTDLGLMRSQPLQYDNDVADLEQMLQDDLYRIGPQVYSTPHEKVMAQDLANVWNHSNGGNYNGANFGDPFSGSFVDQEYQLPDQAHTYVHAVFESYFPYEVGYNQAVDDTMQTVYQDMMMDGIYWNPIGP